jgi:hypothetical protein
MIAGVVYNLAISKKKIPFVRDCTVWGTLDKFSVVQRKAKSFVTLTQDTDYLIPQLTAFEETLKHRTQQLHQQQIKIILY